jgi:hypothetical protein
MRPAKRLAWGLLALALLAAGCQKLEIEKKVTLDPLEPYRLDVEGPRYEQQVTVEVDSPGVPVAAYVVKEENVEAVLSALDRNREPTDVLAGTKEKSEKVSLSATIPAKTSYTVLVRSVGKRSEATVRIKGR